MGFHISYTSQMSNENETTLEEFVPSTIKSPSFSKEGGYYTEDFTLHLETKEPDGKIYYTLDSSLPSKDNVSTLEYKDEIPILAVESNFHGTIVRACTVSKDGIWGDVVTHSYFVTKNMLQRYEVPVVSLVTDSDNLYNTETGLFTNYDSRGREWEKPMHVEYITPDGKVQFSMNVGARLHGGASRSFSYKSFRLYARKEYDLINNFEYDFFSDSIIPAVEKNGGKNPITKFKRLLLRNCGNEGDAWDSTYFRDAFIQSLMVDTQLDIQAYTPSIVYLNGEYYGIMNIRERQDERYLSSHYNVGEEDVAIYNFWYDAKGEQQTYMESGEEPNLEFYNNMYQFITTQDMSLDENYRKVSEWLDIENYVDYLCIQIFSNNGDWPGNNLRAWRYIGEPNSEEYGLDGKIRFLLFDTDFGYGLYDHGANENALKRALEVGKTQWPNQDGSTRMFRSLMKNEEFLNYFSNRYLDLINTKFHSDYGVERIESLKAIYQNYVDEIRNKYQKVGYYDNNIETMKKFALTRPYYARMELKNQFQLGSLYTLNLNSDFKSINGVIQVNTLNLNDEIETLKESGWSGQYLSKVPVIIKAIPKDGYEFQGWEGDLQTSQATIIIDESFAHGDINLTPLFVPEGSLAEKEVLGTSTEEDNSVTIEEKVTIDLSEEQQSEKGTWIAIITISLLIVFFFVILAFRNGKK